MTYLDVINSVLRFMKSGTITTLNDDPDGPYKLPQISSLIKAVERELVNETGCLIATENINVVNGTRAYDLPTDCNRGIITIKFDDNSLKNTTVEELDNLASEGVIVKPWRDLSDDPERWYYGETGQFEVYPVPDADLTDGFYVRYNIDMDEMTDVDDIPFSGETQYYNFHMAIVYGVVSLLCAEEGMDSKFAIFRRLFAENKENFKNFVNYPPGQRLSFKVVKNT